MVKLKRFIDEFIHPYHISVNILRTTIRRLSPRDLGGVGEDEFPWGMSLIS